MRSRMCNHCGEWSPVSEWAVGCPNCGGSNQEVKPTDYRVMKDIKPYISMIDGSEITSRSRHREHLRNHECIEVGNDSSLSRPRKPLVSPPGLKEKIIEAVHKVEQRNRR